MSRKSSLGVLILLVAASVCSGEDTVPDKFYKMVFVVKQTDGAKVLNSRSYTTIVSEANNKAEIRAGSKVPYVSETSPGQGQTVYQQIEIGVGIDVIRVKEVGDKLSFFLTVDISSIAGADSSVSRNPIVRQDRWATPILMPFKKPTLLLTSDDVDAKTQMQIEITATPMS